MTILFTFGLWRILRISVPISKFLFNWPVSALATANCKFYRSANCVQAHAQQLSCSVPFWQRAQQVCHLHNCALNTDTLYTERTHKIFRFANRARNSWQKSLILDFVDTLRPWQVSNFLPLVTWLLRVQETKLWDYGLTMLKAEALISRLTPLQSGVWILVLMVPN